MGSFIVIGIMVTVLLFVCTNRVNNSSDEKVKGKANAIMTLVSIVAINFSLLVLCGFESIHGLTGLFSEIVCACLVILSWLLTAKFAEYLDKGKQLQSGDKQFAFLSSIFTTIIISVMLTFIGNHNEFVHIGGILVAVFLGTFISIDSYYTDGVIKPFSERVKALCKRFECKGSTKSTCILTSIVIILITYLGQRNASLEIGFWGVGIGMAIGVILVVVGCLLIEGFKK